MTNRRLSFIALLGLLAILTTALLAGCAQTRTNEDRFGHRRPCPVKALALAPIQTPWPGGVAGEVIDPITGEIFRFSKMPENVRAQVTAELPRAAEAVYNCPLIPPAKLAGALPKMPDRPGALVRMALAEAGRKVGATTVIAGTIFRFRERIGSEAGVEQAASVYLGLYAIDAQTGHILEQRFFEETQRSLAENLLRAGDFFSRGGRWLTAAELSRTGMIKLISRMRIVPGR